MLPDPDFFLSSQHATITYEYGDYYLIDTSTNGVYVNDSERPLGKGARVKLSDGDRLQLGDFNITVSIVTTSLDDAKPHPFTDLRRDDAVAPVSPAALPSCLDPLDLLEQLETPKSYLDSSAWDQIPRPAPSEQHRAERDDVHAINEYFPTPNPVAEPILEDWNTTDTTAAPIEEPVPELGFNKSASPVSAPEQSKTAPADWPSAATTVPNQPPNISAGESSALPRVLHEPEDERLMQAFLQGAGLDQNDVTLESAEALIGLVGRIFRQMVQDLREVLIARANLKSGLRINSTTIQPVENNPLKFSAGGTDEAMRKLLSPQSSGYLSGTQAI